VRNLGETVRIRQPSSAIYPMLGGQSNDADVAQLAERLKHPLQIFARKGRQDRVIHL